MIFRNFFLEGVMNIYFTVNTLNNIKVVINKEKKIRTYKINFPKKEKH